MTSDMSVNPTTPTRNREVVSLLVSRPQSALDQPKESNDRIAHGRPPINVGSEVSLRSIAVMSAVMLPLVVGRMAGVFRMPARVVGALAGIAGSRVVVVDWKRWAGRVRVAAVAR